MKKTCRRPLNQPKTNTNLYEAKQIAETQQPTQPHRTQAQTYLSPAEHTLQTHRKEPKLVGTADGPRPINEETGFISPYPVEFRGCLGCGDDSHSLFSACPHK